LPAAASAILILWLLFCSDAVDRMAMANGFYAAVLVLALTNAEMLQVLPWSYGPGKYDGLPDRQLMVAAWLIPTLLEDIPQLSIQILLLKSEEGPAWLGVTSVAFATLTILWRAFLKAIHLAKGDKDLA